MIFKYWQLTFWYIQSSSKKLRLEWKPVCNLLFTERIVPQRALHRGGSAPGFIIHPTSSEYLLNFSCYFPKAQWPSGGAYFYLLPGNMVQPQLWYQTLKVPEGHLHQWMSVFSCFIWTEESGRRAPMFIHLPKGAAFSPFLSPQLLFNRCKLSWPSAVGSKPLPLAASLWTEHSLPLFLPRWSVTPVWEGGWSHLPFHWPVIPVFE